MMTTMLISTIMIYVNLSILGSLDGSLKIWSLNKKQSSISNNDNNNYSLSLKYTNKQSKSSIGITSIVTTQDGAVGVVCYQDSIIRFYNLTTHNDNNYDENNHNKTKSSHKNREIDCIDPGLFEAFSLSLSPADDLLVSGNMKGM